MRRTCDNVERMSKMIQIRNVPDEIHRTLKVRAAEAGMSLSEYLLREVRRVAEKPTLEEVVARIKQDPPVRLWKSAAEIIREERDSR